MARPCYTGGMNGGRLSDDEAMTQGLAMLRGRITGSLGPEPPAQALRMIAMRYPEEAERLEADWLAGHASAVATTLAEIERQFAEDCAE